MHLLIDFHLLISSPGLKMGYFPCINHKPCPEPCANRSVLCGLFHMETVGAPKNEQMLMKMKKQSGFCPRFQAEPMDTIILKSSKCFLKLIIVDFDLEFPKYFVVFLMPLLIHERLKIFFLHIDPEIERCCVTTLFHLLLNIDTCRGGGDPLIIGMVEDLKGLQTIVLTKPPILVVIDFSYFLYSLYFVLTEIHLSFSFKHYVYYFLVAAKCKLASGRLRKFIDLENSTFYSYLNSHGIRLNKVVSTPSVLLSFSKLILSCCDTLLNLIGETKCATMIVEENELRVSLIRYLKEKILEYDKYQDTLESFLRSSVNVFRHSIIIKQKLYPEKQNEIEERAQKLFR
uniref:Uncharacterized protein n=1 Tax=Heterorhabditis bacteriophora TaxID=37862 RepID=A0A1I7WF12_HETBA